MVIGFTPENGHCAVDLLAGHYSYHLVGESHLGERQFAVGALIDGIAEAVGSSDDERQVFAGRHLLLKVIGELDRAELASVLIEQDDVHSRRETCQDRFAFGNLDLLFRERLGVLQIRQDNELERQIVLEPLLVVVDKGL